MAYNENIPQAEDNPSQSQGLILDNFQEISTAFNLNHGNFNAPDQGKHSFLQLPEQDEAPVTLTNEAAFYSKKSEFTENTELFFRREDNGDKIEFTSFLGATTGWTILPSGILLKWGTQGGAGEFTIEFPTDDTIPIYKSVFNGIVCVEDPSPTPNTFITLRQIKLTEILVFGSGRANTNPSGAICRYLVIGI